MNQNISEKWTLYAKMRRDRMILEGSSDTEDYWLTLSSPPEWRRPVVKVSHFRGGAK